jgi:XTP/dITP diphosphohydrolase
VREILIATSNPGKFREIAEVLSAESDAPAACGVRWLSLADLPGKIAPPTEDGRTFAANAALKARHYARASGRWTLADDSGLEVDALGGAPGVKSARYADTAEDAPRAEVYRANNRRLVAELQGVPPERRTARFRCALALSDGERILLTAEGSVQGRIIDEPRGANGFGYDPHFFVPELGKTMAELPAEEKNRISHRGQALARIQQSLAKLL